VSEFRIDLRVRFAETDAMGVAHHAAYLPYLETARVEYLRALGHPYRELRDRDGIEFAVVGVDLRYHAPLRFDDPFSVTCALVERGRATFSLAYRVELASAPILSGRTRHAVLDRETGAPRRVPAWLGAVPIEGGRR
jgi:acyl-CoA thioester hydrolase